MTGIILHPMALADLDPAPLAPLAGNWSDDDADVFEADWVQADDRPVEQGGVPHTATTIEAVTRLNSATTTITPTSAPFMLLPPNPSRLDMSLAIQFSTGNAATTGFIVASSRSECFGGGFLVIPGAAIPFILRKRHTGAVWVWGGSGSVSNPNFTTSLVVSVIEVSK